MDGPDKPAPFPKLQTRGKHFLVYLPKVKLFEGAENIRESEIDGLIHGPYLFSECLSGLRDGSYI